MARRRQATTLNDPHADALRQFLEGISPGLADQPEALPGLDPGTVKRVLSHLLKFACRAQHVGNIELARNYLAAIPRQWLVDRVQPIADELIASGGEWEYRRLLELYERLDSALLGQLAARGLSSENADIREAAKDFARRA